ncbi:MAG: D-glycerate dehydrogenase [Planctomyces sp.]|nr:D-glycerate dehydrogenase [Planctomyces sp.]MBA4039401.1 D-glycerate dehydrogenase [Planctomyces sp.]
MAQPSTPLVVITRAIPTPDGAPPTIGGAAVRMGHPTEDLTQQQLLDSVRGATAVVSMFHDRVDDAFIEAAGPQLRGVVNYAVGYNNFDLAACARRGVVACNTPDAVTEGTANIAWGLILAVARRIAAGDRFCRSGGFAKLGNIPPTLWLGAHTAGQTLVIVGAGRIGMAVALRGLAFGMRVLYVARSRHVEFEIAPVAARRVSLEEGLALADVVSLHTPLSGQTRHLINRQRLALMKPTAILVNTARGPVVDEAALAEALAQGRIFGAGLDVFEREPEIHPGLAALDNVVMTPHIGSAERHFRLLMTEMVCENVAAILAGREPPNRIHG